VNGVSYRAANALLEGLAASDSRLHIVAWADQVEANPQLLATDAVHPTPAGYELRARLYARAAQDCR
jgi:lysophospholipase L1-like esterase